MTNVICVLPAEQRHREKLEKAGQGCSFVYTSADEVSKEQVQNANVIIGNVPAKLIEASENLRLLQLGSAGADQYIVPGILGEHTVLTNATGAYSKSVAEHAFASVLMLQKKLHLYRDAQKRIDWTDCGTVTSMADATVLVVGLGDIGGHFARMCKALGAYVIGIKRRPSDKPEYVDELYTMEQMTEQLPRADVIFSILPGTAATYHLYTAEMFKLMKNTAIFVNCGRGGAVEGKVLYEAIVNGEIGFAAIDVTEPEPLPADDPLWTLDNVFVTPHASGFYHLPETFERIIDIAADNLGRFVRGEELRNVVDMSTGYKK